MLLLDIVHKSDQLYQSSLTRVCPLALAREQDDAGQMSGELARSMDSTKHCALIEKHAYAQTYHLRSCAAQQSTKALLYYTHRYAHAWLGNVCVVHITHLG